MENRTKMHLNISHGAMANIEHLKHYMPDAKNPAEIIARSLSLTAYIMDLQKSGSLKTRLGDKLIIFEP